MYLKSYVILHVSSRLPEPVQKRPRSCSNVPLFESNAAAARPLCLSALFGFEIRLQWFIVPLTLGQHPSSPAPETSPSLSSCAGTSCAGASCVMLGASWGWSMTVRLRRGGIPLHKLTLEKVGVRRVGRQLQDLENDVGVHLTKTCCAGIVGPADVRGNPNQARKVGDQVPGNLWHRGQSTNSRVHGTGQVRHVVTVAVKLLHNPPRT